VESRIFAEFSRLRLFGNAHKNHFFAGLDAMILLAQAARSAVRAFVCSRAARNPLG
jgi:hypothetical protein